MISTSELTKQQQEEAARIKACIMPEVEKELEMMANLLASQPTDQFFGSTEFHLRGGSHRIRALSLQASLDGRKKGPKGPA